VGTTLITGGAGFIGTRLARLLRAEGERVVLFDRAFVPDALEGLGGECVTVEGDVRDSETVIRVVSDVRPDGIVHLAAILSGQCEVEPARAFQINVGGTFNVLEAARQTGVGRVVATSSAAVYEEPEPAPPRDEDHRLAPLGVYGMTKTNAEVWCRFYARRYRMDTRIARPGAVVGPGRVAGGAASSWTTAIVEEPLRGHSYVCPVGPDDSSTLVYHSDLVDGLFRLYRAERVASPVYNLGACSASAGELARLVQCYVPGAEIAFRPDPIAGFVVGRWRYVVQDSGRARRDLGWRPRYATPADLVRACAEEIGVIAPRGEQP
jgi:nucleoside-diphosphate-sugar epimerase